MEEGQRHRWWVEALRAGIALKPRVLPPEPGAGLVLGLIVATSIALVAASRTMVPGPAGFDYRIWLSAWCVSGLIFVVAWALHTSSPQPAPESAPVARWFVASMVATMPISLAGIALGAAGARNEWDWPGSIQWGVYIGFCLWGAAVDWRVARTLLPMGRAAVLVLVSLGAAVVTSWLLPQTPWYSTAAAQDGAATRFKLDQEVFEKQQALLAAQLDALPSSHQGGPAQLYGIVFAPYGSEDVFRRESEMVAGVLADRFNAKGRIVQLVNSPRTVATHAWATPLNLNRTVDAIAKRMDRDKDILVVYLTSHGASDFRLAAWNWPLEVEALTPASLRAMLDAAGIKFRVIAISACFSGGWVDPLASDTTLVMTAADAQHTSYGCGRKSELTYFGRAVFDEQLRSGTRSFEEAFTRAVPVIRDREQKAGKSDGFSNPQLRAGEGIRSVLAALQGELERSDTRK